MLYDGCVVMNEFTIFPIYLFYGMAFFAIGVAITSRDTRASNLKISRSFWLFALFAYTHALLEWFALYLILLFLVSSWAIMNIDAIKRPCQASGKKNPNKHMDP